MGTLAQINTRRGLPRGRGSLPPEVVARAQRQRILRAMVSAVATLGYGNVRIADVVNRARVSRQSFYALFADKEECFLAAHTEGLAVIVQRLDRWTAENAVAPDPADAADHAAAGRADPTAPITGAVGAYLQLAADEPEFAHCMLIELPAIGLPGLQARLAAHRQIAELLRGWHEEARRTHPEWPPVPSGRYAAAVGAVHDLLFDAVASGRPGEAPTLCDDAVDAVLTLLQIPRA
ncbi:MAG: TetR/AcrR family transcriptional regulator [Solirubrobacteraceae bacterium]